MFKIKINCYLFRKHAPNYIGFSRVILNSTFLCLYALDGHIQIILSLYSIKFYINLAEHCPAPASAW